LTKPLKNKLLLTKKSLSIFFTIAIISLIVLLFMQPCANATNQQNINYQSLNITKEQFFKDIENKIQYYNNLYGTNISLDSTELYSPLPRGEDGWYRYFTSGFGSLAVKGPENNIEEVYYITYFLNDETLNQEAKVARYAFEETLFEDNEQRIRADNWFDLQLLINTIENRTVLGERTLWYLSAPGEHPYSFFCILGAPESLPPGFNLPWWTILSIISAIIAIITAGYKAYRYFSARAKKQKLKP
jgi:hypothetical protein